MSEVSVISYEEFKANATEEPCDNCEETGKVHLYDDDDNCYDCTCMTCNGSGKKLIGATHYEYTQMIKSDVAKYEEFSGVKPTLKILPYTPKVKK